MIGVRRTHIWGALIWLASAHAPDARAGDEPATVTQDLATADGAERLQVPASWKVEAGSSDNSLGAWRVTLPSDGGVAALMLQMIEGVRDERLGAAAFTWPPDAKAPRPPARFVLDPVPHAEIEQKQKDGTPLVACVVVRVIRRRGYALNLTCRKEAFAAVSTSFLAAARTLDSTRAGYPDMPDSYRTSLRDGYEYHAHPGVKDADVASIHRILLAQEAAYAKRYGPVPKPTWNPLMVVVNATAADAASFGELAGSPKDGLFGNPVAGCLFAVPIARDEVRLAALLAGCFAEVLHHQVFPSQTSDWHSGGDYWLAHYEAQAGRPFPQVAESLSGKLPAALPSLRDLAAKEHLAADDGLAAAIYMAFFRSGAKPYADGFAAYVKDVRAGVYPPDACAKWVLSLDQGKLRAAAEEFMHSFKPVKGR